jgi:hypothetical protein
MKPDMDLSEFCNSSTAQSVPKTTDWIVTIRLKDGSPEGKPSNLTVGECHSEFEAKERAFHYLLELVYRGKE